MDMEKNESDDESCCSTWSPDVSCYSPTPEPEEARAPQAHLEHFKAHFDQNWDYEKIAKRLFLPEPHKCLVMKEHANLPNTHVHFQGYTDIAPGSFENKRKRLAKHHYSRKTDPKSRPISAVKRTCTTLGFQYMSKELKPPLYSHGFTEDELTELKEKSQGVVKALKFKISDFVRDLPAEQVRFMFAPSACARTVTQKVAVLVHKFVGPGEFTYSSRYTRQDILKGLLQRKDVPEDLVGELMML